MDDLGFPRTPDRPVKLLGTCVRYMRSIETSIGVRGPDFLGGSAIVFAALDLALVDALEGGADGDDPAWYTELV